MISVIGQPIPEQFKGSLYYNKVEVDFGELPNDIINDMILQQFEPKTFRNYIDHSEWKIRMEGWLKDIPAKYRLLTIQKGIEFGGKAFKYHQDNECTGAQICKLHEVWQRRIEYAEDILNDYEKEAAALNANGTNTEPDKYPKDFTTARQVLAIHYLLEYCKAPTVDKAVKARFIQFLTGRETGAKEIKNTTIYKKVAKPLSNDNKTLNADLNYVRKHFEDLGLSEVAKMITNEISKSEM